MTFTVRETRNVDIEYTYKGQKSVETFVITQFTGETGWKYGKVIQKVLVPIYAEMMQSMRDYYKENPPKADEESEEGAMGLPVELMPTLFKKASQAISELDDQLVINIICDSLSKTPSQFNTLFTGKTQVIVKLLIEIIKFNYEDVFTELGLGVM